MNQRATRVLLWILALAAIISGIDNFGRPLANPDEGRYSEISREMVASGDWVTPRLNGLKYFEKPPLQYWASAVAFSIFPQNEYSARLYIGLCCLGALLLVTYTARRLGTGDFALATMIALISSPYFMALGSIVTLDTGLTAWTTLTFCAYLLSEHEEAGSPWRRRWMLLAWAGIALAVLSKGLIGIVFPAAALGAICLVERDFRRLARMQWIRGIVIVLVIAAPWFVAVSLANPEFPEFFFIHEHFQRFLTSAHRRTEPWWYFVPIVFAGFLPWMFALPSALAHGWRLGGDARMTAAMRFAILWGLFVVAFFSASGSKLPAYILPAFPALGLVLGRYLAEAPTRKLAWQTLPMIPVAIVLLVIAWRIPAGARDAWTRNLYEQARPFAMAGAVALMVLSVVASAALWRGRRWVGLLSVAIGMVLMLECVEGAYEQLAPRQSGKRVAEKMKPHLAANTRLYSVRHYEQTVPFYIGRTMTLVEYVDEFEPGERAEPDKHIEFLEQFPMQWLREGDAMAIIQPDFYEMLRTWGLPMQVLYRDPRRVLVRKP